MADFERYLNGKRKVIAVPGPVAHRSPRLETVDLLFTQPGSSIQPTPGEESAAFEPLPCVLYECNAAFELTYVSENISELCGLDSTELIGTPLLSDQRIPVEDLVLLSNRLGELEHLNKRTSLMHRMLTRRGLPFWVAHSLWKASLNDTIVIRGCIVPMDHNGRLHSSTGCYFAVCSQDWQPFSVAQSCGQFPKKNSTGVQRNLDVTRNLGKGY